MNWLAIIGLILNVIGSFLFIIDSNRLSGMLAKMVHHMADGYGTWDSNTFEKHEIEELQRKISTSKRLTSYGYLLFIGGFILQLIASVYSN
ncbi:MAG: hypothetical protein ACI85Q_002362 [Salibacteraceae bacterium]|jgi:hypothetical protein